MAYSTSNPPVLRSQAITGHRVWSYVHTDAAATVDTGSYFTNGYNLGMRVNDIVFVTDTTNGIITSHKVVTASASTGAAGVADGSTVGSATNTD